MTAALSPGNSLLLLSVVCVAFGGNPSNAQSVGASFSLPPLEEFGAIVERPLFSPDRKPVAAAAPDTNALPVEESSAGGQLLLAGTATDQGNRAVAILHDVAQGTQYRVRVGDQVAGWTIQAIRPRQVVLANDKRQVTITLDEPTFPKSDAGR